MGYAALFLLRFGCLPATAHAAYPKLHFFALLDPCCASHANVQLIGVRKASKSKHASSPHVPIFAVGPGRHGVDMLRMGAGMTVVESFSGGAGRDKIFLKQQNCETHSAFAFPASSSPRRSLTASGKRRGTRQARSRNINCRLAWVPACNACGVVALRPRKGTSKWSRGDDGRRERRLAHAKSPSPQGRG